MKERIMGEGSIREIMETTTRLAETKDPTDKGCLEPTYCKLHKFMSASHS